MPPAVSILTNCSVSFSIAFAHTLKRPHLAKLDTDVCCESSSCPCSVEPKPKTEIILSGIHPGDPPRGTPKGISPGDPSRGSHHAWGSPQGMHPGDPPTQGIPQGIISCRDPPRGSPQKIPPYTQGICPGDLPRRSTQGIGDAPRGSPRGCTQGIPPVCLLGVVHIAIH